MRVIHFVKRFSVLTETFIYDQIQGIDQLVSHSTVITEERLNTEKRPFHSVLTISLKKFFSDYVDSRLAYKFNLLPFFIKKQQWREAISKEQPTIVHCHAGNAARTFFHIANKLNLSCPIVVSLHGSDVTWEPSVRPGYKRDLHALSLRHNVRFTVPSLFLKEKAQQNLSIAATKIDVVRNGVNPAFYSARQEPAENQHVICVGRFIACKGQLHLIDAFQDVVAQHPEAHLTLVGDGPMRDTLVEKVKLLGLEVNVTFIANVPHSDIPALLARHKVYVQPSIQDPKTKQEESFGVAALEAGTLGLKVVVSDLGGLPEAIQNLSGFTRVVPPQDSQSLSVAICNALDDHTPLGQLNTRDSQEQNAKTLAAIYEQLTGISRRESAS